VLFELSWAHFHDFLFVSSQRRIVIDRKLIEVYCLERLKIYYKQLNFLKIYLDSNDFHFTMTKKMLYYILWLKYKQRIFLTPKFFGKRLLRYAMLWWWGLDLLFDRIPQCILICFKLRSDTKWLKKIADDWYFRAPSDSACLSFSSIFLIQ